MHTLHLRYWAHSKILTWAAPVAVVHAAGDARLDAVEGVLGRPLGVVVAPGRRLPEEGGLRRAEVVGPD